MCWHVFGGFFSSSVCKLLKKKYRDKNILSGQAFFLYIMVSKEVTSIVYLYE